MSKLGALFEKERRCKVLCLGAHSDDIEIGCGGTILKLQSELEDVEFHWVVFGANRQRGQEAVNSAKTFLGESGRNIMVKDFQEGFFPYSGAKIKEFFEDLKNRFWPDIIFTHYGRDMHQDHRVISELTWNTFRNHLILEYEVPKYDGDFGTPNIFVPLSRPICQRKIEYTLGNFVTQKDKHWFTDDMFWGILRLRGIEANCSEKYAEAFYCRKLVL